MSHPFNKTAKIWSFYTPPARPSRDDLFYFEKFIRQTIKNKRNARILVLGATPEFREMLLKFSLAQNTQVTLIDVSPVIVREMDTLIHFPNKNEKKVIGNWLKMPFARRSFNAVIGHAVLEQIDRKNKDLILKNIDRALKPGGVFVVCTNIILNKFKSRNIKEGIKRYINLYLKSKLDLRTAVNYLDAMIWRASMFKNKERIIWMRPILDQLKKMKPKNKVEKLFINKVMATQGLSIDYKWWPETKKDYEKLFKKYFSIKEVVFSRDYEFANSCPIYYLIKK